MRQSIVKRACAELGIQAAKYFSLYVDHKVSPLTNGGARPTNSSPCAHLQNSKLNQWLNPADTIFSVEASLMSDDDDRKVVWKYNLRMRLFLQNPMMLLKEDIVAFDYLYEQMLSHFASGMTKNLSLMQIIQIGSVAARERFTKRFGPKTKFNLQQFV